MYYYGARWYDASLARFISADTIVPHPGNPQALNRYSYVLNNPLRYTDPTGHAECAAGDTACWQQRWYAQNDWHNAHGYFWDGSFWLIVQDAIFATEQLLYDAVGDAGISFASGWNWNTQQAQMTAIGQGIVRFGQALIGGLAQLQNLLGGGAALHHVANTPLYCFGAPACALPPGTSNVYYSTDFLSTSSSAWIAMTTVHELAHVIDWHSEMELTRPDPLGRGERFYGPFSAAWHGAPLTSYAACGPFVRGNRCGNNDWERWAEAVTVFVYGQYMSNERGSLTVDQIKSQIDRIWDLLNGRQ